MSIRLSWLELVCILILVALGAFAVTHRVVRPPEDSDAGPGAPDALSDRPPITRDGGTFDETRCMWRDGDGVILPHDCP